MFSKQDIQGGNKYSFLKDKMADDFNIPDDGRSKIIFGYNGIGKTTIYRFIKEFKEDDRILFLDYIDERSSFERNKKKLLVSPNVNRINDLNKEIIEIKTLMSVKDTVKSVFGVTNGTIALSYGAKIVEAQKNDAFSSFTLTREEIVEITDSLGNVPADFIVSNYEILEEARTLQEEIDDYRDSYIYKALLSLSEIVRETDITCPICDSDVQNIDERIRTKMNDLRETNSRLVSVFKANNIPIDETTLNNVVDAFSRLNESDKRCDWMICNGQVDRFDMLLNQKRILEEKENQLADLEVQRDELYETLRANEVDIKNEVSNYFNIEPRNIRFSSAKKTLTISLPREVKTYSTGEMNFLAFIFRIYEFIGSDKQILVLDDPVSSLDIINHYKIAYKLVKTASTKNVVILTHSIELLNTINSQYGDGFDFYYIEEANEVLMIHEIERVRSGENILALNRLLGRDDMGIINAMIHKENSDNTEDIHKLFHYSGSYSHPSYNTFDNEYLVSLIDNYEGYDCMGFLENAYNKVILIASIRVWVEKQMRLLISDLNMLSNFDEKYTITQKINYLFPRNGNNLVDLPNNFSREKLMTYKVMMNQGIHYQSQVMPFAYALNISIMDLNSEIHSIKELFS